MKEKRSRTPRACYRCKFKKSKCDGSHPCATCAATESACVYIANSDQRTKSYERWFRRTAEEAIQVLYQACQTRSGFPGIAPRQNDGTTSTHAILQGLGLLEQDGGSKSNISTPITPESLPKNEPIERDDKQQEAIDSEPRFPPQSATLPDAATPEVMENSCSTRRKRGRPRKDATDAPVKKNTGTSGVPGKTLQLSTTDSSHHSSEQPTRASQGKVHRKRVNAITDPSEPSQARSAGDKGGILSSLPLATRVAVLSMHPYFNPVQIPQSTVPDASFQGDTDSYLRERQHSWGGPAADFDMEPSPWLETGDIGTPSSDDVESLLFSFPDWSVHAN